jgi:membrane protein
VGIVNSLKARLEAFQRTKPGLFIKKVMDDQVPNMAALLAWGTLSALLPLLLGILGLAGFALTDPEMLDRVYAQLTSLIPAQSAELQEALEGVRRAAGGAAGIGILLLLFNGSAFFANMASVFDQAYHVESRNFFMQRVVAILMLIVVTLLIVVSTVALSLGSLVESLPFQLPFGPAVARVISWSVSIVSAILLFMLLYKVLPNADQGWRHVIPGTLLSVVLFYVIVQLFPVYMALFPPNQAYAAFGIVLVFTFFLYLLGLVFVLGAELNAFLQEPARAAALAEATKKAHQGQANIDERTGKVEAEATGDAPQVAR